MSSRGRLKKIAMLSKLVDRTRNTRRARLILVGVVALVAGCAIAFVLYEGSEAYMIQRAETEIRDILLQHKALHHYIQRNTHPALYTLKGDGELKEDFYSPALLSSSYMIRNMHTYLNEERIARGLPEIYYKMAAVNPRNPVNMADDRERELVAMFNANREKKIHREIIELDGEKHLYVAVPFLTTNEACLKCHGERERAPRQLQAAYQGMGGFGDAVGHIRAIESIRAPIGAQLATAHIIFAMSGGALLSFVAIFLLSAWFRSQVRQRTAELQMERDYSSSIVQGSPDIVCRIAQDGTTTFINPAGERLTGYKANELVGKDWWQLFYPGEEQKQVEQLLQELERGEVRDHEMTLRTKDGGQRTLSWSSTQRVGDTGGMIGIGRDVSERRRVEEERRTLEAQVQHAQKLESLGVLAGGIAHDFNNLLMAILGNADLALQDLSNVSPARDNIEEIEKASRRAAGLCQQMLAYSGRGKFVIEDIDLSEAVEEIAHMLEVSTSKKAVMKYSFADSLPLVEADVTQMRQVIMNLITNASEAIGDKSGVISVKTDTMECDNSYLSESYLDDDLPAGLYTYIEVTDTGCGMDKETQAKLFDPFYTTKFAGRGLGLSAVLGIVRGHRGAIKVYSEPGKGTTFKVLFPSVGKASACEKTTPSAALDEWRGQGTILVADDEESVCAVGKRMLERQGFTVLTAADGREALEVFRQHDPEIVCVLLDLTMPHLDGEQVFRELRRIRKDVRVIVSSGYNEQEITQRFAGKGLAGFIQKPYQCASLIQTVRQVLEPQP